MDGLAGHQTATDDEEANQGVEFQWGTGQRSSERNVLQNPALGDKVAHERGNRECGWDRGALKVLGLSGGVLGEIRNGDIEARKTGETTEHKEGEEEVVDWGTKTYGESRCSWGDTK